MKKKTSLLLLMILMAAVPTISNALSMGNNDLEQNDKILDTDSYEIKLDSAHPEMANLPDIGVALKI